jgi:hypothetical protein
MKLLCQHGMALSINQLLSWNIGCKKHLENKLTLRYNRRTGKAIQRFADCCYRLNRFLKHRFHNHSDFASGKYCLVPRTV